MKFIKNYYNALQGNRGRAAWVIFLISLSGLLEGAALLILVPILNKSLEGNIGQSRILQIAENLGFAPEKMVLFACFSFVVLGILSAGLKLLSWAKTLRLKTHLEKMFRKRLSEALFRMRWSSFISLRIGELNNSLIVESQQAAEGIRLFASAIGALLVTLFFLAAAFLISVTMTWITLIFIGLGLLWYKFLGARPLSIAKKWTGSAKAVAEQFTEIFGNLKFFRSTGRSKPAMKKLVNVFEQHASHWFWANVYTFIIRCAFEVGGVLFLGGILIFSLYSSTLPLADVLVFFALFYRLVPRIQMCQDNMHQSFVYQTFYLSFLDHMRTITSHPDDEIREKEPTFDQVLEVKNLRFSYPNNDRIVLQEVCFSLKKGGCLALVGESGSGKSTMIDLITGLLKPNQGQILLDGAPLSELDLDAWRSKIGLVLQESPLFHTTVLENISWGYEPDRKLAEESARLAHAWDFISALPEGLDTIVGEKGGRLSGGQKQRIALARALYRKPWILILDEATSALDGESEKNIQESLEELKGQFAILLVAHRLKTIQMADDILVLGEGRALEEGTWNDLIHRPQGVFRKMASLQGLLGEGEISNKVAAAGG